VGCTTGREFHPALKTYYLIEHKLSQKICFVKRQIKNLRRQNFPASCLSAVSRAILMKNGKVKMKMTLKQALLLELESNRNADLSGQMLAKKLNVSRNAVWKAINALKQDGYEILSGTNKGYRLAAGSDLLSAEGIGLYLSGSAAGLPVFVFQEIDSTNNEAKRMLAGSHEGPFLIVSECQSKGRGRHGRSFYSPGRTGLYMTLAMHPESNFSDVVSITTMAAVAVVHAVSALTDKNPLIKWVNDIYLNGRKICGILTEAVMDFETGTAQSVLVGIGVNVRTMDFPEDLSGIAASLEPSGVTRNQLAAEIASRLLDLAGDLSDKSYLDEYRAHSMVLGKRITYYDGDKACSATAIGIDGSGGLVIQNEDGSSKVLSSGEISIRLA